MEYISLIMCVIDAILLIFSLIFILDCIKVHNEIEQTNNRLKEDIEEFEFKYSLRIGRK